MNVMLCAVAPEPEPICQVSTVQLWIFPVITLSPGATLGEVKKLVVPVVLSANVELALLKRFCVWMVVLWNTTCALFVPPEPRQVAEKSPKVVLISGVSIDGPLPT